MARDLAKDDKVFNGSQNQEHNEIVNLYNDTQKPIVRVFLISACAKNTIHNNTHQQVYKIIKTHLGYPIPN